MVTTARVGWKGYNNYSVTRTSQLACSTGHWQRVFATGMDTRCDALHTVSRLRLVRHVSRLVSGRQRLPLTKCGLLRATRSVAICPAGEILHCANST